MKPTFFTLCRRWLLWLAVVAVFVAVWRHPISNEFTRSAGLLLFGYIWFGLLWLVWKSRAARFTVLGITGLAAAFLLMPSRSTRDTAELRKGYVAGLLRYADVHYIWGGESPRGIDCSGLVRRGLIDSLFSRGLRTLDGALVRHALWLWWNDRTARELGDDRAMTTLLLETPSIDAIDPAKILPGDIAVTANGIHIMAYLGDNRWIEADASADHVLTVAVPSYNVWFGQPMKVVRWNLFTQ